MKTNTLRLPLYILYTFKQVEIFQSRRIKSTVIAQKTTALLLGDYKTLNQFKKTTEWENGAIFVQKWLKAQTSWMVLSPRGLDCTVLKHGGYCCLFNLRPVSKADLMTSKSLSMCTFHCLVLETSLYAIYKSSFGHPYTTDYK